MIDLRLLTEAGEQDRAELAAGIASLRLAEGQTDFVPAAQDLLAASSKDPERQIFAVVHGGEVVGTGTLHRGAAESALDWPGDFVLLRGLLIDRQHQGQGYGSGVAAAAVGLAQRLFPGAEGVVLGVNEANTVGRKAYQRAGYRLVGRYSGADSGRQEVMTALFSSMNVDDSSGVN